MHSDTKNDSHCSETELINQELRSSYLKIKSGKDNLEKRKYTESIVFIVTGEGLIIGWTESASQLVKKNRNTLQNTFIHDYLTLTDGQSFSDISSHVKPQLPVVVSMAFASPKKTVQNFTCKITVFSLMGDKYFFLVLYPDYGV
jgi:hypothetical protein